MLKNLLKRICYRIYLIGKLEEQRIDAGLNEISLQQKAIIGKDTRIGDVNLIQNSTGDNTRIRVGNSSWINAHLLVFGHGGEITVGDHCFIGKDSQLWSARKISVGDRVLISHNVNIHDNISHPLDAEERHADYMHLFNTGDFQTTNDLNEKEIIIEDDVWIGFNVTILKGVTIGKGAIIGACTLVKNDVPAGAVVVGNPARIIRYADQAAMSV